MEKIWSDDSESFIDVPLKFRENHPKPAPLPLKSVTPVPELPDETPTSRFLERVWDLSQSDRRMSEIGRIPSPNKKEVSSLSACDIFILFVKRIWPFHVHQNH